MQKHWSFEHIFPFPQPEKRDLHICRSRRSIEHELQELQTAYLSLIKEHVSLWSNLVIKSSSTRGTARKNPEVGDELQELIDVSLEEILSFCSEALSDLQNGSPASTNWNKHIEKILAYGRVTAILLHRLQSRVRMNGKSSATVRDVKSGKRLNSTAFH